MLNFRMRKFLARLLLPMMTVWLIVMPGRAYASLPAAVEQAVTSARVYSFATGAEIAAASGGAGAGAVVGAVDILAAGALIGVGAAMSYFAIDYLFDGQQNTLRIPLTAANVVPAPAAAASAGAPVSTPRTTAEFQAECAKTLSLNGSLGGTPIASSTFLYLYNGNAWCQRWYTPNSNTLAPRLDTLHNDLSTTTATTDPTEPAAADMPGWGNTFGGLTGWQLPSHSSACPTPSVDLSGVLGAGNVYSFDAHCGLIQDHFNALQAAMMLVWTIMGIMIVLRA